MSLADNRGDTIAAIATAPGRSGIGVIRLSGPLVPQIARDIVGTLPAPRLASLHAFTGAAGEVLDQGLALYFPAPHSFTGEHVLELQGHGGPVVLDAILARLLTLGARLAEPGEFSRRAFLNGKIDLIAAEAIADLIDSSSIAAARAALRSLQGEFSGRIHDLVEALTTARLHIEAAIDFPEEEIDFLSDGVLRERLTDIRRRFTEIIAASRQGALLKEGLRVVIAGKPNAGKSSLLNRLAGYEVAIVTPVPGTTRDPLREHIHLDGLPLHIVDTAGLRDSPDVVEAEGIRRARDEMTRADHLIYVVDATDLPRADELEQRLQELPAAPVTVILNKVDLAAGAALETRHPVIRLSAKTGEGLADLRSHLKACAGFQDVEGGAFAARRRHLDALARAEAHALTADLLLVERKAGELVAEELRAAQHALGEITGEVTSDELLGRIFSSFCIGK